jgi:hypothetical protein
LKSSLNLQLLNLPPLKLLLLAPKSLSLLRLSRQLLKSLRPLRLNHLLWKRHLLNRQ